MYVLKGNKVYMMMMTYKMHARSKYFARYFAYYNGSKNQKQLTDVL